MLFTGLPGIGKKQFARFVVESLLCLNSSEETGWCGECDSCRQLMAGSHPEFHAVEPEGASMSIKVDSVRELVNWLQLSAPPGRYRAALLDTADSMNRNAANSLLKTLEEPGERAILVLSASSVGKLPATIRSRCQTTVLRISDPDAARAWLREEKISSDSLLSDLARVGPYEIQAQHTEERLTADKQMRKAWTDLLLMRASVGKIVDSLSDYSTAQCLTRFSTFTMGAAKMHMDGQLGVDPASEEVISAVYERLNIEQWFTVYDRLQTLHRSDSASFKTQTVLEGLFADIRLMTQG